MKKRGGILFLFSEVDRQKGLLGRRPSGKGEMCKNKKRVLSLHSLHKKKRGVGISGLFSFLSFVGFFPIPLYFCKKKIDLKYDNL